MTVSVATEEDAGRSCPYCRFPIKANGAVSNCDSCGSIHHSDCWNENAGCAVTGCASGPSANPAGQTSPLPPSEQQSPGYAFPPPPPISGTGAFASKATPSYPQPAIAQHATAQAQELSGQQYLPTGYGQTTGPVGLTEAISDGFRRTFQGRGRSSRSAYWWFQALLVAVLALSAAAPNGSALAQILAVAYLLMIWPSVAVLIRRLHDTGRSGWWYFIVVVPFVGFIALLVFLCQPSEGDNRYGSAPSGPRS
jgi:uncharacterized membrane protein YhaH (DUF805 family)